MKYKIHFFSTIFSLILLVQTKQLLAQSPTSLEYNIVRVCQFAPNTTEVENCETLNINAEFTFDFQKKSISILLNKKDRIDLRVINTLTLKDGLHIDCSDIQGGSVSLEVYDNGEIWLKNKTHLIIYR
jgi:hypothetical protein